MSIFSLLQKFFQSLHTITPLPSLNLFKQTPNAVSSFGIALGVVSFFGSPTEEQMKRLLTLEEFELKNRFQTNYDAVKAEMDIAERERTKKKEKEKRLKEVEKKMLREAVENLGLRSEILMSGIARLEAGNKELKNSIKQLQEEQEKRRTD